MKRAHWLSALLIAAIAVAAARGALAGVRQIDVQHSKVTVYVYKQGLFSIFADNHEIDAPIASGSFDAAHDVAVITIDAAKIKVLDPKLSADRRNSVQSSMAGPQVLDVAKYPTIAFRSTNVRRRDTTHWTVTGDLTLHGETHPVDVDVVTSGDAHFDGSATIRQSAFGITPIRIAGGTVSVKDDVKVAFSITLAP